MSSNRKAPLEAAYPREARFFGVCPLVFCDTVYQIIDDYLADAVDAMETEFKRACEKRKVDLKGKKGEVVEKCLEDFLARARQVSDRNVDTFELYVLKNIFSLPKDVPLTPTTQEDGSSAMEVDEPLPPPEDRVEPVVLQHMPSATEEQEVDNDLRQLRSMLRKVRRDGQAAAAKQRELEGVLKTAQSGLYHLQLIEQDLGSTLDEPFTTAVKDYVAQQAQVVSLCRDSDALAEMLRKKMQGRKGVGTGGSDEEEGAANGHAGPEDESPTSSRHFGRMTSLRDIKTKSVPDLSHLRGLLNS